MRKRLLAIFAGVLALILAAVGLGFAVSTSTATPTAAGTGSPDATVPTALTELETLAQVEDEDGSDESTGSTGTPPGTASRAPSSTPSEGPVDGDEDLVDGDNEGDDEGDDQLPTLSDADTTGPTITVKPESVGGPAAFSTLSLKLFDAGQVDYVVVNGVTKQLSNNQWSDVNGLKVGQFGIEDGQPFTVVAFDVAGNSTSQTFTLDVTGPTITVKPESVGGPSVFSALSLKLYDRFQVDYVVVNGVTKQLTNNQWSDVNGLKPGQFGIGEGVPFTVVAFDVAGNSTTATFTLDVTGPTITVKPESVGGPSVFSALSLKLYDRFQVDYVVINGVTKDLTNNQWSDVNGLKVGQFGIEDGKPFTVVAFDVAGNSTTGTYTIDGSGPTITVKPESVGGPAAYKVLSLKLFDKSQVDYVVINGTKKELTNSQWSDVNGLKVGQFGIQDNVPFTVVAYDVLGNSTTATFVFDLTAPTITVKPDQSVGGPDVYSSLSLKLYDAYQIDYVTVNGVQKELTNDQWSDVNFITVGQFGIQDGVPFTVVAYDVLGNSASAVFTLDGTAPTATEKSRTATSVSLKLFDRFNVDYVVINGVTKDLVNNQWSDANDISIGSYGIQSDVEFSVIVVDVAGNSSTYRFTLTAPAADPEPDIEILLAPVEDDAAVIEDETASE